MLYWLTNKRFDSVAFYENSTDKSSIVLIKKIDRLIRSRDLWLNVTEIELLATAGQIKNVIN